MLKALLSVVVLGSLLATTSSYDSYEVWLLDQQDSLPTAGGTLYIYNEDSYSTGTHIESYDFANLSIAANCSIPRRPHMASAWPKGTYDNPTPNITHVIISFVGSGDIQIYNARTRELVGCVRTVGGVNGTGGSVAMHMTHVSATGPDTAILLGMDIGAPGTSGFIQKVTANFATNEYELVETLAASDYEAENGALVRPICGARDPIKGYYYLTLQSGGVMVLDPGTEDTPMQVKHLYTAAEMPGSGCAEAYTHNNGIITSSEKTTADSPNDTLTDYLAFWPNGRLREDPEVFADPTKTFLPGDDTHGVTLCRNSDGKEYLFSFMRISSTVVIVDLDTLQVAKVIDLSTAEIPVPTPDISQIEVGVVEGSWRIWVAMRGITPVTGISIPDSNRKPGIASLVVREDCLDIGWDDQSAYLIPNITAAGLNADPHGMLKLYLHNPSPSSTFTQPTVTSTSIPATDTDGGTVTDGDGDGDGDGDAAPQLHSLWRGFLNL